jgi:hypothetical protein
MHRSVEPDQRQRTSLTQLDDFIQIRDVALTLKTGDALFQTCVVEVRLSVAVGREHRSLKLWAARGLDITSMEETE